MHGWVTFLGGGEGLFLPIDQTGPGIMDHMAKLSYQM